MVYRTRNDAVDQDVAHLQYRPQVWSAFVDEQWKPMNAVLVRPGVRLERVTGAGFPGGARRVAAKAFLPSYIPRTTPAGPKYQVTKQFIKQEGSVNLFDVWIGA